MWKTIRPFLNDIHLYAGLIWWNKRGKLGKKKPAST